MKLKKIKGVIFSMKKLLTVCLTLGLVLIGASAAFATDPTGGFALMNYDPATGLSFTPATLVQAVIGYVKDIVFYASILWAAWAGIKWIKRLIFGR